MTKRDEEMASFSVAPDKIPIAKQKLQAFLYELALELSSGECSQVYFLTTALIPVSKDVSSLL